MNIIILDLEWNQPFNGRTQVSGLPGEIIQIGAVRTDELMNALDSYNQLIKPVYYTRMNKWVKELTLITDKDLEGGKSFVQAAGEFRAWCGADPVFVTWGPDDILMLKCNLEKSGLDTSWLPPTYDGQLMFDDQEMQEDRQWPLNYALYHYNEKPDGAHNALADVYSTIAVLRHLDMAACLKDEYFLCSCNPEK